MFHMGEKTSVNGFPIINVFFKNESTSDVGSETDFDCGEAEAVNRKERISGEVVKKHVCPYDGCQFAFNRPWKLSRHINTHTKQRPFKCDFPGCSKDYTNKSHLDRHKSVSHCDNKPPPVCILCPYPECTKVFMNKWSLKRHFNTHKNKELYSCTQCNASFKKSKQLKQHLCIHMGVKPFECETCKASFETEKDLKLHKKKHKVYTCEFQECQKQFNTWNLLRKHIKLSHSTLYTCDSCAKTFKNKWTLTEHVFSHLPDHERETFACPYSGCQRFYFHQRNLEHHLKSFHQDINYKCDHENCERSFVKKEDLKKHQKVHEAVFKVLKKAPPKIRYPRKPRFDKGQHRKSMAALLSGIVLPYHIDKNLAQNNITIEVLQSIESTKKSLLKENRVEEIPSTDTQGSC